MSAAPLPLPPMPTMLEPGAPRQAQEPSFAAWWLGSVLFISLSALLLLSALEWEHYRRILSWRAELTLGDRALVGWLLWAKSILPLMPILFVAGLIARRRKKLASMLLGIATIGHFFWLAADLVLYRLTGNHCLDYLPYLQDALASTDRNHLQWAGDSAGIAWRCFVVLAVVSMTGIVLGNVSSRLSRRLLHRCDWIDGLRGGVLCTAAFVSFTVAAVPAQALFSQRLLLRRLHTALPVDLTLVFPHADHPSALARRLGLDTNHAWERGVRIVALVPDPASEDDTGQEQATLHNFSKQAVSLDGWRLRNSKAEEHELCGEIQPQQSLSVVPSDLQFSNDGDEVELIDAAGRLQHQVKYRSDHIKYGGVISFREEGDLDEFLLKTNQGVQAIYRSLREELLTPRPVDQEVPLDLRSPPHVVCLVLESFREAAVSPELMRRLDAWGQQGLRLRRHYAGSNSSHLGLFALLYGRSPLVYHPTVDANIPPQTTHTLRAHGYHCTFVTSGDCTNFRKMERFLNEQQFDRVIQEDGNDWRDWPQRDRRALFRVREILEKAGNKPQFVMAFLMSTHFPYSFPPEFDVHQPSAADAVTLENWKAFDTQVLHNRYKNAALSLEEELMRLIHSLDPHRHLIVVTGDHGESMSEDGALAHASRGSEAQCRVPFLMVGPGLPPLVVEEPTTHTDALPTLLHSLCGREVKIRHAHGRDLLSGVRLDGQVMICPFRWKDPYDMILVRGANRMQFKIRLDRPAIEAYGFCDTSGNLDLSSEHQCTPTDAVQWTEAFRRELLRIVR